jgi:hypothetical protein
MGVDSMLNETGKHIAGPFSAMNANGIVPVATALLLGFLLGVIYVRREGSRRGYYPVPNVVE